MSVRFTGESARERVRSLHGPSPQELRAQRLAWTVIIAAFAIWCGLVVSLALAIRDYVLTAANPQHAVLEIQRGVVFYQDSSSSNQTRASSGMGLTEGTLVETAELTEASLSLFDGSAVHLFPSSQVRLEALRIGRFSESASRLTIAQRKGAARYTVAGGLPNGGGITVFTPHGALSLERGEYLVWVTDEETSLTAYAGKGHVEVANRTERFRYGQRVQLLASGALVGPQPLGENLVKNGSFANGLEGWDAVDVQEEGRKDVPGARQLETYLIDGILLRGLRITRETEKDTHNETGIVQTINRDVLPYRNLYIRAWVKVDSASLSGGGYAGSEYPIMIQVDYVDSTGGRPGWSHGFYYANPENRPVINAELIPRGTWVHYEGNLVELKDRPAFITAVRVIGSGHDFDSAVANVELIAE